MMRSTKARRLGLQPHEEDLVRADRIQQLGDVGVGFKGLGDEQQPVPGLAVELAGHAEMPGPLLIGQGRVRPHQHFDFDGRVGGVVV